MPTNAVPINIGKAYNLSAVNDNGAILFMGDASPSRTSVKTVMWVPDLGVVGDGFTLVARIYGPQTDTNGTAFVPIPYRRVNLSGVASDRALVSDTLPVTGFLIEVPANAQTIAIIPAVTSGGGWLYHWDAVGSAT